MNSYYLDNVVIYTDKNKRTPTHLTLKPIYKKRKLKKLIVKDKIINIDYNINNLYCKICCSKECFHIDYIYSKFLGVESNLIYLFYSHNFDYDVSQFDKDKFTTYCYTYLENNECCYCLGKLSEKYDLWRCDDCKHLSHYNCIKKWIKKKKECPLCKKIIVTFGKY